jgi:hypothetical protein
MPEITGRVRGQSFLLALLVAAVSLTGCSGVDVSTSGTAGQAAALPPPPPDPTLTITTTALPPGQMGVAYRGTLVATGGTAPLSWVLTAGALPAGLELDSATGVVSGMPAATAAAVPLTFTVTDSGTPAQQKSVTLNLTVSGAGVAPLNITTNALPSGQVGVAYQATLAASGGTAPLSWALTAGTLPAGLTLTSATGLISGTPTASATAVALTFTVTDSGNPAQNKSVTLSLTISPATPPPLTITTSSLPNGQVGVAYQATLTATGGTAPLSWALTTGTLPAGLTLTGATGLISGTPTASATAVALTFTVTDSGNPAQQKSVTLSLTVTAANAQPLNITTTSLPPGRVGVAYAAALTATGGQSPLSWALTAGTLPAGLTLTAAGVLSGMPTATAAGVALTFTVTDSGGQQRSVTLKLNISPAGITVSVSPRQAGLTLTQTLPFTATTNDYAGVTWSVAPAGGSFSAPGSASGVAVTFTAPSAPGVYTVTATSVTNSSVSAAVTVGVTDLAGVYTYHHDLARDGANTQEYALTPANVNTATFGKLFSCTVDGAVYAQPLWVASLVIGGARRNVIFVATAHDSLFAFDADANPCVTLWQVSLIDTSHGATAGEVTVPSGPTGYFVGQGGGDITPEVGVIGTPVIDSGSGILYVVSKSMAPGGTSFYQRLHAIDITTGNEKPGSPTPQISASYPGTGTGGASVAFSPQQENQRAGLALVSGTVYIAWASHEDTWPYWGWMMGYTYNGAAVQQSSVLNDAPNTGTGGGIWMSGAAPAADVNGNLYVITGNGGLDAENSSGPTNDYGDCFLQLNGALGVLSWFAPSDEATDAANDHDFGSGGAAVVLNLPQAPAGLPRHLVVGGGKDGTLVLLNGDNMGGFSSTDAGALQNFAVGGGIFSTAAFWNNTLYMGAVHQGVAAYAFDPGSELFTPAASPTATSQSPETFGWPGSTPAVSASGASGNGIVWALNTSSYCTPQSKACGPAVLYAYDASNLATELWNSTMVATDAAGNAVKFTVPTVANGKVYVGTRGNNTGGVYGSTSVSGEVDVYGLKP